MTKKEVWLFFLWTLLWDKCFVVGKSGLQSLFNLFYLLNNSKSINLQNLPAFSKTKQIRPRIQVVFLPSLDISINYSD